MEKYTVDIDKVLDDFEENEALNLNNKYKDRDDSLLEPSVSINSCEENQLHVSQDKTECENVLNEDDNINSCEENCLNCDKNKLSETSVHTINCVKHIETPERSNRINFNVDKDDFKDDVESDICQNVHNESSTSVLKFSEVTDNEKREPESSDENDKFENMSSSSNNACTFQNDSALHSNSQSVMEKSQNPVQEKSQSPIQEKSSLISDYSEDIVILEHSCNLPLNEDHACNNYAEDVSQHVKSNENNENSEQSEESESILFSANSLYSFNLNACACTLNNEWNVLRIPENSSATSTISVIAGESINSKDFDNSASNKSNQNRNSQLDNATLLGKHEDDVQKLDATALESHEQSLKFGNCISNSTGVENREVKSCGLHCNCGLHCLVHAFETAAENVKQSLKNDELHSDSNMAAAASREPSRCDCHRLHSAAFCMHPGICPHMHDNFSELSAEELQYRHRSGADNSHALNPINDANRELNRCGCWGIHPPNVCFHQNVRLPIIPIYEDISDDDDDSGVSSEDDHGGPLFFFNNRIINYNDGDQRDGEIQNLQGPTRKSDDELVDLMEAEISDQNNLELSDPPVVENSASSAEFAYEVYPSASAMNCQSPNKFTGARSKLEVVCETSIDSKDKSEKSNSAENVDLKSDNEQDESEAFSIESLLDDCDNCQKSSDICSVNISSHIQHDNSQKDDVETKCDTVTDSIPVATDDNGCLTIHSDVKGDSCPQRLPRPTTLDLPSRHVDIAQISESERVLCENNLECVTGINIVSDEMSISSTVSEESPSVVHKQQPQIGLVKPFWIPDAEASNCMHCGMKFTVIKRRHHCRACGKVLCSRCCNLKAKLAYLNKEDRICRPCFEILSYTSQNESASVPLATDSQSSSSCGSSPNFSPSPQVPNANFSDKNTWRPHPNNPDDYCSTIPPLQQVQLTGPMPPPTVLVPIGVLKRGNKARKEPKQVIFSDGIRPGGDLTDLTEPTDVIPVYRRMGRKRVEKAISGDSAMSTGLPSVSTVKNRQKKVLISDEEGPLPPIVIKIDDKVVDDKVTDDRLDWNEILGKMQDDDQKPINFALLKNMHLFVKLTKLDCCFGKECWCFTSHGLCAVGQDEIMVILERLPGENTIPRGIIKLFTHIYDSASKGSTYEDLGHIIFPEQILGSSDHRGFLFVRPTFQCLSKLIVPNTPFLVAILIHKWEVPWAKVFPLRLMLRLGAECRYYPCALVSVRDRKPVFFEIGQTIMSVLADLRNYQFTIPVIPGLVVHMEENKTCVNIPRNRYEKVMKVLNSNNVEHVLALGSNFSTEADSHLVCMQKEAGDYQTRAINIENTTRRVTGASFIVFSGALKSSSGLSAKFSIVEDGLLVQIPQETMVTLHMSLRDMKDLTIECGQINAAEPEEVVIIQWTRDDKKFNIGIRSSIDGKSFEGIPSLRIHTSTDYAGDNFLIRWTEVFFLEVDESGNSIQHEMVDPCRLAETVAQSCCMALAPYLDQLAESELTKIGLRVTLDAERDKVEYDIGARGKPLPAVYMNALDCGLIPVILRLSSSTQSEPVSFELIFHILIK